MAQKIMREVTQAFFGTDGHTVLYAAGQRLPAGEDLPDWVTTRDVVVNVPDEPKAEAKAEPPKPAGKVTSTR